jgi:hypothetical protein
MNSAGLILPKYLACLAILMITACATPAQFSTPDVSFERARKALEFQSDVTSPGYSDGALYSCRHEGEFIHYNGNTTLQLVNCLMTAPSGASRLVIASSGGNVDLAIFAAYVLKTRALDVEVSGICMSSCANYILPAAKRVFLDQHSAILVHGAGGPPSRESLTKALEKAGTSQSDEKFERVLEENLKLLEQTYLLQKNFQKAFRVGAAYYALEDIWSARSAMGQTNTSGMIRVDPPSLQDCLPDVEIIAEEPNLEGLEKLLPKYNLGSFADVRGAGSPCSG